MFCDALDKRQEPPVLPRYDTIEAIREAERDEYGHLHANILALLKGNHASVADGQPAAALCCTSEGFDRVTTTDAVFTETLAKVLLALRIFSFS